MTCSVHRYTDCPLNIGYSLLILTLWWWLNFFSGWIFKLIRIHMKWKLFKMCRHSFVFETFVVSAGASSLSPYTLSSLGKRIRHSFREKRQSLRQSVDACHKSDPSARDCDGCKQVDAVYYSLCMQDTLPYCGGKFVLTKVRYLRKRSVLCWILWQTLALRHYHTTIAFILCHWGPRKQGGIGAECLLVLPNTCS